MFIRNIIDLPWTYVVRVGDVGWPLSKSHWWWTNELVAGPFCIANGEQIIRSVPTEVLTIHQPWVLMSPTNSNKTMMELLQRWISSSCYKGSNRNPKCEAVSSKKSDLWIQLWRRWSEKPLDSQSLLIRYLRPGDLGILSTVNNHLDSLIFVQVHVMFREFPLSFSCHFWILT